MAEKQLLRAGALTVDLQDQRAWLSGQPVDLGPKPFALLVALMRSPFLQDCVASGDLVMPFPRIRMPSGYRHVLAINPDSARKPHVETFLGWLTQQFERAPRLAP